MDVQYSYYKETVNKCKMCIFRHLLCSIAILIASASAENIVASSKSRAESAFLIITAAAATLFLSLEPSV